MTSLPAQAFINHLKIKPKRPFSQWIREEVVIPEGSQKGLMYRPKSRPAVAALVPFLEQYKQSWIAAVPRLGKSLIALSYGLWRLSEYGDSVQFLAPDQKLSHQYFSDKLEPCLLNNKRLKDLLPSGYSPKQTPRSYLRLNNGATLRLIFNAQSIRSYDSKCLIATEASQFAVTKSEADVLTLAQKRQDDHFGGLQIFESTHTRDNTRFANEIKNGTNSYIVCPCPHCHMFFEAGKREYVQGWDVENESEVDTHIVCPHCEKRIDECYREAMQKECKVEHRRVDASVFSVSINWFHAKLSFEEVGQTEWRLKNNPTLDGLRNLQQNIYCEPVSQEDENPKQVASKPTKESLIERRANYESGTTPNSVVYKIGSIDVQKKWLYWCLLGFDASQSVYWLDWGVVEIVPRELQSTMNATPEMVLQALETTYQELMKQNPASVWLDTSYKHESSDVPIIRQWASKYSNIFAIAGRSHTEFAKIEGGYSLPSICKDYMQPRTQPDNQVLWFLDVDRLKTTLSDKMMYPPNSPGGVYFPKDLHEKGRNWLLNHLLNEEPQVSTNRFGVKTTKWVRGKWARSRNDLWDCSVYAFAGGLLYAGINPISKEENKNKPKIINKSKPVLRKRRRGLGF